MYQTHFGLRELPFKLTPDPEFYYNSEGFRESLSVVTLALANGEGFIKVTGEVGTGKTTLCRKLLSLLGEEYLVIYLPNPLLDAIDLYRALADELGIPYQPETGFQRFLETITARLVQLTTEGKKAVVMVDEAQSLPAATMEALRLMTNLETDSHKIIQVVLFGQQELDQRLSSPELRSLRQRITFACKTRRLTREETVGYVTHRLQVAGYNGSPLFTGAALRRLYIDSAGAPRLLNVLCHKALLAAYGEGVVMVDQHHARLAAEDTFGTAPRFRMGWLAFATLVVAMASTVASSLAFLFWSDRM